MRQLDIMSFPPGRRRNLVKELMLRDVIHFRTSAISSPAGADASPVSNQAMAWFGRFVSFEEMVRRGSSNRGRAGSDAGASTLATSVRFENMRRMPLADGGSADLRRYPVADRREDLCHSRGEACRRIGLDRGPQD
jgi:hypothetical protein